MGQQFRKLSLRRYFSRHAGSRGASSFHLIWEMPEEAGTLTDGSDIAVPVVEVSAVLEVIKPPRDEALYFWALQVDLADEYGVWGGAHTGLQWNRRYPGGKAVNWGGCSSDRQGALLTGTVSTLSGFPDDPNTVFYPWRPGQPYRLRVYPSSHYEGGWRAEIADLSSGESTAIRDLLPPPGRGLSGSRLLRPMVWTETFAPCNAPSVIVSWSDFQAKKVDGTLVQPGALQVNYQPVAQGGCPNTTVLVEEAGRYLQVTNTVRAVPQGTRLLLPALPAGTNASLW